MSKLLEMVSEAFALACERTLETEAGEPHDDNSFVETIFDELDNAWEVDRSCAHSLISDQNGEPSVHCTPPSGPHTGFMMVRIEEVFSLDEEGNPDQLVSSVMRHRTPDEDETKFIVDSIATGHVSIREQRNRLFR